MTKPTGRPRGRPKTKEYVTLMARFPQELAERLERYAGRKRQTISDVLRDGVLVLLQEDDPYRPFASYANTEDDITSDKKEEREEPPDVQPVIVSDIKEALPESDNVSDINNELEPAAEDTADIVYDVKKARQRKRARRDNVSDIKAEAGKAPDRKEGKAGITSDTKKVPARKKQAKRPARLAKRAYSRSQ